MQGDTGFWLIQIIGMPTSWLFGCDFNNSGHMGKSRHEDRAQHPQILGEMDPKKIPNVSPHPCDGVARDVDRCGNVLLPAGWPGARAGTGAGRTGCAGDAHAGGDVERL